MSSNEPVSVHILEREYTIGVEPGERSSLMAAAKLLDSKMREVRGSNKMAAVDRVAVLAALNMAQELRTNNRPTPKPTNGFCIQHRLAILHAHPLP